MIARFARSAWRGARRLVVPVAVFVAVTASLVLATRRFQAEQIATVRAGAENELLAVADLKVDQLMAYHRERVANAASVRASGFTADGIEELLGGTPRQVQSTLAGWFRTMATQYGYSRIALARPDGTLVREWPRSSEERLAPVAISAAREAFATGSPAVWHGAADGEATSFHILAPVFRSADGAPLAILALEADIEATMSAAAHWPVPRQTARVSFLAERPGNALKLTALLASEEAAAGNVRLGDASAQGLLARPGTVQRVRERERDVLAVAAAVPGTPWIVVTQIDEDEVLALARARGLVALLSVGIATAGLAIATAVWIRRASQAARKRETALRTELDDIRRQFLTLSGLLNDALLLVDRSGRILDANDRAAETYGYTIEELRDLAIFDLGVPSAVAQAREQMEQIVAQGGLRFETAHRRRDESIPFPVEVSARAIRGRTGDLYYCVVRDLSELTRLHTQLAFADRMASVGTLAAGVAHEINNPLAYVLANIGYAEEELAGLHCDEVKQALADAREGARRVRQIVLDLKAFAREDERAPGATDVGEAVRFALSLVQNEVRHRARLEVDVGEIPAVRGSEHRIGQVLVNLLVNAAHAIPPGRASENLIAITARRTADGDVEISVRDTGVGIAAEVLPRIFDPFFTTKPVGTGTGLGLAVCHGIVAQLGGCLRVESTVGEGSTFRVVLPPALEPANEPAVEAPDEEHDAAPLLARARVLVIDDEPLVASSVARVLGSTCVVESAHDATAALSWAAVSRYDLVLCDLMMPDVSGAEFYAALLAKSPELAHRTVFLTGGAFTDEAQAFLSCVNPPVVPKPFEPQQLRLAIARALSPRRETRAA